MKKSLVVLLAAAAVALLAFAGCGKTASEPEAKEKVKLSLHIMSKCPYGVQVANAVKPVKDKLGNALDLEINFIGNEKDGSWMPMHGETELKGDKIAVCMKKYAPKQALDLMFCMNKEYRKIPETFDACASELKLDAAKIKGCAEGEEGKNLVEESYKFSKSKNASGSPTIFLNDQPYRGGRGTNDFLRALCAEFKTAKPQVCSEIPEPKKVHAVLLTDKRCPTCRVQGLVPQLKSFFPGLEEEILDYSEPKGKEEYDKYAAAGQKLLPIIALDPVAKEDEGFEKVARWIEEGAGKLFLRVGAKFDPTKEICDNQIDDTGNGKIDCADDDCKEAVVCRKEIPGRVDLFVMSQCPYGVMALNAMKDVMKAFKGDKLDFHVNYIANETGDGKFQSLHGQGEVDENIRELCAIKHYPKDYMDYIWCRNENIRSNEWKQCAKGKIKADVIEKCFNGDEGKKLHSENIKLGNTLGIGGSPTWFINNKFQGGGVAAPAIQKMICDHNPNFKGCAEANKILPPEDGKAPQPQGSCG